jgi:hypothetical protein
MGRERSFVAIAPGRPELVESRPAAYDPSNKLIVLIQPRCAGPRPLITGGVGNHAHASTFGSPHRQGSNVKVVQTEDIYSKVIRCDPLPMKNVYAALAAEMMLCPSTVPLIGHKQLLPLLKRKSSLRHLHHQGVAFDAKRAIARRQFDRLVAHSKTNATAMAGTRVDHR